jgi:hypothetical protein
MRQSQTGYLFCKDAAPRGNLPSGKDSARLGAGKDGAGAAVIIAGLKLATATTSNIRRAPATSDLLAVHFQYMPRSARNLPPANANPAVEVWLYQGVHGTGEVCDKDCDNIKTVFAPS